MNSQKLRLLGIFLGGAVIGVILTVLITFAVSKPTEIGDRQRELGNAQIAGTANEIQQNNGVLEETHTPSSAQSMSNPGDSWNALIADDLDDREQLSLLVQTAMSLQDEYGIRSLNQIYDSLTNPFVRDAVMSAVLYKATQEGFQQTFEQAKSLEGEVRRWALHEIVRDWARSDPQETFKTVWQLESIDPEIRMLQRRAAWEWAESNPRAALSTLDTIPDNIRDFAEEKALLALAQFSPTEAIEYLPGLSGSKRESTLAMEIITHWTKLNPDASIAWAEQYNFSTEELRTKVVETAFRTYAREIPELAFRTAMRKPNHLINGGMEAIVVEEIAKRDIDLAVQMLPHVRDDPTTIFNAYLNAGQEMARTHLEFDRAIELGSKIPIWKDDYYGRLAMHWASFHPVELLNRIESFPSNRRSHAALCLVTYNTATLVLSSMQVEQAKSYLDDSDRVKIRNLPKHYTNRASVTLGANHSDNNQD